MNLLNIFRGKELQEVDPSKKDKSNNKPSVIQNILVKAVGSIFRLQTYDRDLFTGSEYNLKEIKEAIDTDSYAKIAFQKYTSLFYKSGWKLKAENQEAIDYVLKRFKYMSIATGKPIDILFQEVSDDLYKYSNAFLLKSRVDSLPGLKASPVMSKKIVGGYFRIDPTSIKIKRDKNGNILKYQQGYGEEKKEFAPEDVIHFYMDKDANNAFGTPRLVAALDDIKLLRKLEGNTVSLVHRHVLPMIHAKIGLPQPGMQGTDPEITKFKQELRHMPLDGTIITTERTEFKTIGAEGTALNVKPYLEYFESRVFTALGVSASQMGRGGAKQDAESMEAQIHDTVKYVQRIMSIFIEQKIMPELLLEGGFDIFDNKNDVKYKFGEISLETQIKKENHEMTKYQSNLIPLEEARRNIGIRDAIEDEERLYQNLISKTSRIEEIDRTAEHTMELEKFRQKSAEKMQDKQLQSAEKQRKENAKNNNSNNSSGSSSTSNSTKTSGSSSKGTNKTGDKKPRSTKSTNPNGTVTSRNRPQNQHGTHSVKVKESLGISKKTKKEFKDVFKIYKELRNDINRKDKDMLIQLSKTSISDLLKKEVEAYKSKGIYDATAEVQKIEPVNIRLVPNVKVDLSDIEKEIDIVLKDLFKDMNKRIRAGEEPEKVVDSLEYRLRFLVDFVMRKTYWYAFAKAGNVLGMKKAYVIFNSEEDSENRKKEINTASFSIDDIPAYHSFCNCKLTYQKEKAGE